MRNNKIIKISETAIMATLSFILNLIIVYQMPQGGSISIGAMVPIILIALRRGAGWGVLAGTISAILQMLFAGYVLHPVSIILDYLLAYGILGIVGFFNGSIPRIISGTVLAVFARFASHLISGATIFASYAPEGQNPWAYSLVYNSSYMIPEMIITIVFVSLLYKYANHLFSPKK